MNDLGLIDPEEDGEADLKIVQPGEISAGLDRNRALLQAADWKR